MRGSFAIRVGVAGLAGAAGGALLTYFMGASSPTKHADTPPVQSRLHAGQLKSLQQRIDSLEQAASRHATTPAADSGTRPAGNPAGQADLELRLSALEQRQDQIREALATIAPGPMDDYQLAGALEAPSGEPDRRGEELFRGDGSVTDRQLDDTMHRALARPPKGVAIRGIQCKSSVCKLTYDDSLAAPGNASSTTDSLISSIASETGGADLHIHHDRDAAGNQVLYVQLK